MKCMICTVCLVTDLMPIDVKGPVYLKQTWSCNMTFDNIASLISFQEFCVFCACLQSCDNESNKYG